jgi:hypothetical protein
LELGIVVDVPEESIHTRNKGVRIFYTCNVPPQDWQGNSHSMLRMAADINEAGLLRNQLLQAQKDLRHEGKVVSVIINKGRPHYSP